jgi:hypothetical protein
MRRRRTRYWNPRNIQKKELSNGKKRKEKKIACAAVGKRAPNSTSRFEFLSAAIIFLLLRIAYCAQQQYAV